ncbi:proline racemase [Paenibacillus endophyticus]|uniref:Proline racemase n=1 Tax=Paenibacillus endophyticus TaxID=1294268 RepID=A0A7W5GCC0_9BACL|nr:proline racemase family protein [Paenibacillus endophyticus]MBB3154691.1 proline racemase [Paenibacillus endophyticus]
MKFSRMAKSLDVHVAGWPLRVLFDVAEHREAETLEEKALRLWQAERSPLRWLQHEPRGHAAMRIGVVTSSRKGDYGLMVFDSEGMCLVDGMDALCAALAMTETGLLANADGIVFETESGSIAVGPTDSETRRSAVYRLASSELASYRVVRALDAGLSLHPRNAYEIEEYIGSCAEGKTTVLAEEKNGMEWVLAAIGRDGCLVRAPHMAAIGAMLAKLRGEGANCNVPHRFIGLAGGLVECMIISTDGIGERDLELVLVLTARARLVASCEFILDPLDELGEGFLLR